MSDPVRAFGTKPRALPEELVYDGVGGPRLLDCAGIQHVGFRRQSLIGQALRDRAKAIRSVPESDERIHRLQAGFLTDFMRRVRQLANEAGSKGGRPLAITAMVGGPVAAPLRSGCDIKTWIEQKLVDEMVGVAVLTRYFQTNGVKEVTYSGPNGRDAYRDAPIKFAETGADGLFIWDFNGVQNLASHWAMVRRLGHTDEAINAKDEKLTVKRIPLKMLGGMDVCHTRSWGGCNALVTYTGG